MANTTAVVKSLRVVEFDGVSNVVITVAEPIDAIVCDRDAFGKVDLSTAKVGKDDHFTMPKSVFVAQTCNANDDIAFFKACQGSEFGQKELGGAFFGATINFDSELIKEGDEFTKFDGSKDTAENDFFDRNIKAVKLSAKGQAFIDRIIYG